jgi:hypothetical protein
LRETGQTAGLFLFDIYAALDPVAVPGRRSGPQHFKGRALRGGASHGKVAGRI